ncbi:MAG: Fe2+-dependent dioxygenase [Deltaproteobacteria bacterium]|nr:Fe2+-dependent dioxygenase [Deltaproteobacteria bacterium]
MSQLAHFFTIDNVISETTLARVLQAASAVPFHDGARTAGRWEGQRKCNTQADREGMRSACDAVMDELMTHRALCKRVLPHEAVQPMLSRYRVGDFYGPHEDSPIQSGIRADLSYSLFLGDPSTYEGGELVLGEGKAAVSIKLPSRSLVCYPTGLMHQVLPVTAGQRLVLVGWMQSLVRDPGQRDLLHEVHQTTDRLAAREGLETEVAALSRVYGRLLRQWAFA